MATSINFPTYGFINDILALNEENWRKFFKPFVYDSVQSGLETTVGTGMTINVSSGECRCGAVMGVLDNTITLDVTNGHGTYDRIDSVIVRYSYGNPSVLSIAIKNGVASGTPTPPTLGKVYNTLWEMEIAQILVPAGATSASSLTITDKRVIYDSAQSIIDDNAGDGDTDVVWSANKDTEEIDKLKTTIITGFETIYGNEIDLIPASPNVPEFGIVIGGINLNTGANVVNSARLRTSLFKVEPSHVYLLTLQTDEVYRFINAWDYSSPSNSAGITVLYNQISQSEYPHHYIIKTNENAVCVRTSFAFDHDNSYQMTETDIQNVLSAFKVYDITDSTLTKHGVPADAKVTGEKIRAITNEIDQIDKFTFQINFPVSNAERGSIIAATGEPISSTIRLRFISYVFCKKGDILYFKNRDSIKTYVACFIKNDNDEYDYVDDPLKTFDDTSITQLEVPFDCYIQCVFGFIDNREITDNDASTYRTLLSSIYIKRVTSYEKLYIDGFEPGSLSGTLTNGLLLNTSAHNRYRSENLYDIQGSTIIQCEFNSEDINNIDYVNILLYNSDFTQLKVIDGLISDNNIFGCYTDGYPYAHILAFLNNDITTFHNVIISADNHINKSYLPSNGNSSATYRSIAFNYTVQGEYMSSGRLILPPNYQMNGKKAPLVVFAHGSTSFLKWATPLGSNLVTYFNYMADEGYAVFECYPFTTKANLLTQDLYSPIMIPLCLRSYIEGIKYVCKRFNVDSNNVSLLCKSQGGNIGHWAYMQTEFPFRAVGLFAPTTDPVLQKTNQVFYNSTCRQAIMNTTSFEGTTAEKEAFVSSGLLSNSTVVDFLNKNKSKIVSMMPFAKGIQGSTSIDELFEGGLETLNSLPQWMVDEDLPAYQEDYDLIPKFASNPNYAKYAQCPVKFWAAFDDAATSTYGNYAIHKYLLNGGSFSSFRVLPLNTGGHHAMDSSPLALKSSGTTALGIEYTDIPTAFVEFVQFINEYMR